MNEKRNVGFSAKLAFKAAIFLVVVNAGLYLKFGKINFFFASIVFLIMLIFAELYAAMRKKDVESKMNLRLICVGFFIALFIGEIVVRLNGGQRSYYERIGRQWESPYKEPGDERGWFHTWTPNSDIQDKTNEFNYSKKSNSLGLIDVEHSKVKAPNEFRLIGIGDSFTEGIGSPWLCNWPYFLDTLLENTYGSDSLNFQAINAGVAGSDVYHGQMMLKQKLIHYQPDMVISAINFSDVSDVILRGGNERFLADTIMTYNKGPWYEPLYGSSHFFRLLMDIADKDDFYLSKKQRKQAEANAKIRIADAVLETAAFCKEQSIHYVAVFHPFNWETSQDIYSFQKEINTLKKEGVQVIDLYEAFESFSNDELNELYWPIDHHHNEKGYRVMTKFIFQGLIQQGIIDGALQ